jgi:fumarylacetoacetase
VSALTWVDVPTGSDFTLANLPFGVADVVGVGRRVVVAIGEQALDLEALRVAGALPLEWLTEKTFTSGSLNPLMGVERRQVRELRSELTQLLQDNSARARVEPVAVHDQRNLAMVMPVAIGDYVDFYSSEHHATNLGRILRPNAEPLLPNWKHLPVSYHGRSGTVVVSGTDVVRPHGLVPRGDAPAYVASEALDFELEVGAFVGIGSPLGSTVSAQAAPDHLFGAVLLNDWSARDIQAFEYQPLGPHLAKSFASSISPWVVTIDALHSARVPAPEQHPPVARHLQRHEPSGFDITLTVSLSTALMRERGLVAAQIVETSFSSMYWTLSQQLAHITAGGASLRTGDFFGSGTVSGPTPSSVGSMIELTWRGDRPLRLPSGEERSFLEDGDEITMRGWTGEGDTRVGFGTVTGTVVPAQSTDF